MTRWCGVLSRRLLAAGGCAAVMIGLAAVPAAAATSGTSGDSPSGFWYGTDSFPVTVTGSAPYKEPVIGGRYGGYIGMIGNWARSQGCGDKLAWSSANSKEANTNLARYRDGIGTGAYWFMGGPGMDPRYNGATTEAHDWGERQAAEAVAAIHANVASVKYPVVFMDVEIPGHAPGISPAPDNGWNDVYTSPCSGRVKATYVAASVDRADLSGFSYYLTHHSSRKTGVYSAPSIWADIFGTGSAADLSGVYEWTYSGDTSSLSHHPAGWTLRGTSTCAQWFGGVRSTSADALMWQWSGGGGTYNGHGDFDQIDAKTIH
jgi:hypothetical protein